MYNLVKKNRFGFYELKDKPTPELLKKYYSDKYYQEAKGSYQQSYSIEEIEYINNKIDQKYQIILSLIKNQPVKYRLLDIGSGEGWALKYFKNKSWDVMGLDYSDHGCSNQNPECVKYLKIGDIYDNINYLIYKNERFDCIWLDNVLEHVIDPFLLIKDCINLITSVGVLVIEVPNDFSTVQKCIFRNGYISKTFWVVSPDHISYFNKDGLTAICDEVGWLCRDIIGDYPIDLNLFNEMTNYIENRPVGKLAHKARVEIENLIHSISSEKTIELYRVLAQLGLGREIIGFFQLKEKTDEQYNNEQYNK
ncbi:MAG: class I SAM-dependent methyltransferase [Desulfocucumaceae bacterium]